MGSSPLGSWLHHSGDAPANLAGEQDRFVGIDLSYNEIKKLENLPSLKCLRMLLLTNNHVSEIGEGLAESLSNLEVLGLAGNHVVQLAEVERLVGLTKLNTLTLAGKSITMRRYYREYIIHKLPQLHVLDDCEIRAHVSVVAV
jgi:U2 small nuclear ribonucleoprotein A'